MSKKRVTAYILAVLYFFSRPAILDFVFARSYFAGYFAFVGVFVAAVLAVELGRCIAKYVFD